MPKPLLILDLDETLIYASETRLERDPDFQVGPFHVYRRPFLSEFLAAAGGWFNLAVWSSATGGYVQEIVANVFGLDHALRFVWSCERCTRRFHPELQEYYYAKNLDKIRKLGFPLEQILMLDDSPEKLSQHYGNHLRVSAFSGSLSDTELRDVLPFLEYLRGVENLRKVEKRYWRQFRRS